MVANAITFVCPLRTSHHAPFALRKTEENTRPTPHYNENNKKGRRNTNTKKHHDAMVANAVTCVCPLRIIHHAHVCIHIDRHARANAKTNTPSRDCVGPQCSTTWRRWVDPRQASQGEPGTTHSSRRQCNRLLAGRTVRKSQRPFCCWLPCAPPLPGPHVRSCRVMCTLSGTSFCGTHRGSAH